MEFGCSQIANVKEQLCITYKGVKRRFTYQIKSEGFVFIDDYAHHPTEINAVYHAVKRNVSEVKKLRLYFNPIYLVEQKILLDEFAESLSQFEAVFLLEIYPARELPIAGISSELVVRKNYEPSKKSNYQNQK